MTFELPSNLKALPARSQSVRISRLFFAPRNRAWLLCAALSFCARIALAAPVIGTITNGTTGKPSSGDTLAAVNMARSMDEIAHASSDAHGVFHITVPDDGQILLHVTHRGADYYKTLSPGATSADIEVFDSAARLPGIVGEALVLRFETDPSGKTLNVSENFFLQNSSTPPRTEFGANTFDFYLPANAQVTQSLASAPSGLPTAVKLVPIDAQAGHFAFTFPLRPGETRFQINYTLPYTGQQAYSLKLSLPTGDVAVMLPKTMQFLGSPQFQSISPDPSSQSYDAHQPAFAQPLTFTVSGTGQLPQISSNPQGSAAPGQASPGSTQPTATDNRPGGGLGVPDDPEGTNNPLSKYKWWIVGGLGLALACGAGILLRSDPTQPAATAPPAPDITAPAGMYAPTANLAEAHPPAPRNPPSAAQSAAQAAAANPLLAALKEELFALEADRLAGTLPEAEYIQHKAALDLTLRRALTRANPGQHS